MRYQKGAIKGQRIETDGARWYAIDAALAAMSFKGEIATVRKAKIALKRLKTND